MSQFKKGQLNKKVVPLHTGSKKLKKSISNWGVLTKSVKHLSPLCTLCAHNTPNYIWSQCLVSNSRFCSNCLLLKARNDSLVECVRKYVLLKAICLPFFHRTPLIKMWNDYNFCSCGCEIIHVRNRLFFDIFRFDRTDRFFQTGYLTKQLKSCLKKIFSRNFSSFFHLRIHLHHGSPAIR